MNSETPVGTGSPMTPGEYEAKAREWLHWYCLDIDPDDDSFEVGWLAALLERVARESAERMRERAALIVEDISSEEPAYIAMKIRRIPAGGSR